MCKTPLERFPACMLSGCWVVADWWLLVKTPSANLMLGFFYVSAWCLMLWQPMRNYVESSGKVSPRFPRGFSQVSQRFLRGFPRFPKVSRCSPPLPRRSMVFSGFRSFQGFPKENRGFHGFQVLKTMVRRPIDFADVAVRSRRELRWTLTRFGFARKWQSVHLWPTFPQLKQTRSLLDFS